MGKHLINRHKNKACTTAQTKLKQSCRTSGLEMVCSSAEWQHVSQADRWSREGTSQVDLEAAPLNLASLGYLLCFSVCSWGVLPAHDHRQGSP